MDHRPARANTADPPWHAPGWSPDRPAPTRTERESQHRSPLDEWLQQRLFDQRMIIIHGYLDSEMATRAAAQMVALDALGGHRITLHVDSPNGDIEGALLLMDTMDTLHVPVHGVATGSVGGAALGVLAAAHHRTAFPHARFRLVEPRTSDDVEGTVDQLVSQTKLHQDMLGALVRRLARITLKAPETIERDLREGSYLTAFEAVEYGLVDGVASSPDSPYRTGSGFTPTNDPG